MIKKKKRCDPCVSLKHKINRSEKNKQTPSSWTDSTREATSQGSEDLSKQEPLEDKEALFGKVLTNTNVAAALVTAWRCYSSQCDMKQRYGF